MSPIPLRRQTGQRVEDGPGENERDSAANDDGEPDLPLVELRHQPRARHEHRTMKTRRANCDIRLGTWAQHARSLRGQIAATTSLAPCVTHIVQKHRKRIAS